MYVPFTHIRIPIWTGTSYSLRLQLLTFSYFDIFLLPQPEDFAAVFECIFSCRHAKFRKSKRIGLHGTCPRFRASMPYHSFLREQNLFNILNRILEMLLFVGQIGQYIKAFFLTTPSAVRSL